MQRSVACGGGHLRTCASLSCLPSTCHIVRLSCPHHNTPPHPFQLSHSGARRGGRPVPLAREGAPRAAGGGQGAGAGCGGRKRCGEQEGVVRSAAAGRCLGQRSYVTLAPPARALHQCICYCVLPRLWSAILHVSRECRWKVQRGCRAEGPRQAPPWPERQHAALPRAGRVGRGVGKQLVVPVRLQRKRLCGGWKGIRQGVCSKGSRQGISQRRALGQSRSETQQAH